MGNFMAGGLASNMYWLTALRTYYSPFSPEPYPNLLLTKPLYDDPKYHADGLDSA